MGLRHCIVLSALLVMGCMQLWIVQAQVYANQPYAHALDRLVRSGAYEDTNLVPGRPGYETRRGFSPSYDDASNFEPVTIDPAAARHHRRTERWGHGPRRFWWSWRRRRPDWGGLGGYYLPHHFNNPETLAYMFGHRGMPPGMGGSSPGYQPHPGPRYHD